MFLMYYKLFCPSTYRISPERSVSECVVFISSYQYFYSPKAQNDENSTFALAKKVLDKLFLNPYNIKSHYLSR